MVSTPNMPALSTDERIARAYVHAYLPDQGGAAALDSMANNAATSGPQIVVNLDEIGTRNELRADRWAQRRTVRRVLAGTRPASCGRVVSKETGVGLFYDGEHGARFSGLRSCGSVWVCPVCNHKIQCFRLDEVTAVMDHCKEHDWGVVFGTLTVRHKRKDSLQDVVNMAREVWRKSRSHRRIKDLFRRTNEIGYIRAQEVTYSHANGWHVHFHCYYIFGHVLSKAESDDFAGSYADEWVQTAKKCGYAAPSSRNQKFEVIDLSRESSAKAAARYCTIKKTAVSPQTDRLGHEITDTQSKIGKIKVHGNGKKVLHLTFWDMVRYLSTPTPQSERVLSDNGYTRAEIEALCREYYKATKGCRALVWSRGLRVMCGLGIERTDEEIAAQEFADPKEKVLTIWHWSRKVARREFLAPLLLAICDLTKGDAEACAAFCRSFHIPLVPPRRRFGKTEDH